MMEVFLFSFFGQIIIFFVLKMCWTPRMVLLKYWTQGQLCQLHMNLENMNYKFASFLLSTGLPQCFVGKESTCNAGDTGDMGSVPESGRSPGGGHGSSVQYLAWKIPWLGESGGLQSKWSQRVRHNWVAIIKMSESFRETINLELLTRHD